MKGQENLRPMNARPPEERKRIQMKGALASRGHKKPGTSLYLMLNGGKLTPSQAYVATLFKDKKFNELVHELIQVNAIEGIENPERRDKVIAQIQAMMPRSVFNYNVEITQDILSVMFRVADRLKNPVIDGFIDEVQKELLLDGGETNCAATIDTTAVSETSSTTQDN
jgi:hypothetical protein